MRHVESHKHILAVERQVPGWRVIAGPFTVAASHRALRAEERASALRALEEQRKAGIESRLVMYRQQAYVLRTEVGWREQGKNGVVKVLPANTFRCPLCACGPFTELGLKLHGCRKKPDVELNGRMRLGRLDNDEVRMATQKEGARR